MSKTLQAHLALFMVATIYGANYLVAKGLMPDVIGPSGFIVVRVLGATALFGILYTIWFERIAWKDVGRLIICGLTGVGINQLLFFNGLNLTSPVNASIIMTSNPILVLIASSLMLGTVITWRKGIGVLIGAAGAVLLILQANGANSESIWVGDIFILINAMSYGIYLVAVKPLMTKYKPITVIFWVFVFGMVAVIPVGWSQFMDIQWKSLESNHWLGLGFVVLLTTFLVYLLNIFALKIVQPSVVAVYIYLQPIVVAIFAYVAAAYGGSDYTGELTWERVACALLIFFGVYLVSFKSKKHQIIK